MTYYQQVTNDLLHIFDRYLEITERRGVTTLSKVVAADSVFYHSIKNGTNITLRKADVVMANFATIWPTGVRWPKSIPYPDTSLSTLKDNAERYIDGRRSKK